MGRRPDCMASVFDSAFQTDIEPFLDAMDAQAKKEPYCMGNQYPYWDVAKSHQSWVARCIPTVLWPLVAIQAASIKSNVSYLLVNIFRCQLFAFLGVPSHAK